MLGDNTPDEETPLPDHLIRLPGGQWALWRCVGLRGAGFPAAQVLTLSAPACAALADRLFQTMEAAERARKEALVAVNTALDRLRRDQEWDNTDKRDSLIRALRDLKRGRPPEPMEAPWAGASAIDAFRTAYAQIDPARAEFYQAFDAATAQVSRAIYDVAQTDRFREALIWQNRRAFHTGVEALQGPHDGASRSSKRRQHEELVASYLQRYCVKNDTIGFFGPVGWAWLVPQEASMIVRPGADLLAARSVYFEQWCIDALAEALARNRWLRPWLAPRRLPHVHVDGVTLYLPSKHPVRISTGEAAVLQACTGDRTARAIALDLSRTPASGVRSAVDVYKLLEYLSTRGLITWALEVPFEAHPERALRSLIEGVGEERLRKPALEALAELETARDAVAHAAGDAEKLDQALGALEATFTRLTDVAPTRAAGATYAGRTLVYEDCRRDIEVAIGPMVLDALGPPLSLLLASARWFTFEAAAIYRVAFKEVYVELARQAGAPTVDAATFWRQAQMRLFGDEPRPVEAVVRTFQERWSEILGIPTGHRHVRYTSEMLRPRVLAAFDAPGPGWKSARHHSPDVMIAAASAEAIRCGDYQLVMGELHLGSNTLRSSFFVEQHPSPDELYRAFERDLPGPRVVPLAPRHWPETTSRTRAELATDKDLRLAFTNDACGVRGSRTLPIGALVVDSGDGLMIRTRDGRQHFDIIEFFAEILSLEVIDGFKILRPCGHTPRVTVDCLVICREAWRFAPAEMPFALDKVEPDRFLAARRWARACGMPRFVFVKAPAERKPFYVDFDSPIMVNMFAKAVRGSMETSSAEALITVTEMLPTPDQTWLPDASDQRYTSELRIVAVDPAL